MTNAKKYSVLKTTERRDGSYLIILDGAGSYPWHDGPPPNIGEWVHLVDGKVVRQPR